MDTNNTLSQTAIIDSSELGTVTGGIGLGILKPIAKQAVKWAPKAGKLIAGGVIARGAGAAVGAVQHGVGSAISGLEHGLIELSRPPGTRA